MNQKSMEGYNRPKAQNFLAKSKFSFSNLF